MTTIAEHAAGDLDRVRLTALKAMELGNSTGQSLVKVETAAGLYGVGEAGVAGPACRAHLQWLERVLIGATSCGLAFVLLLRVTVIFLDLNRIPLLKQLVESTFG